MKRIAISFSGRAGGNCDGLARMAAERWQRDFPQDTAVFVRFSALKIENCGGCGYECLRGEGSCPKAGDDICALYDEIASADLCAFFLPNYADFPCANFFAFAERGTGWFDGSEQRLEQYMRVPKRAVVISGGEQENFRRVLAYQGHDVQIMFLSAKDYGQSSLEGRLAENETACERVWEFTRTANRISL